MATSLPWNVKGVDPRTRDAARAAARRAGMTLGEWLDTVIREEAADAPQDDSSEATKELEALSERLSRLNQSEMDTAAFHGRDKAAHEAPARETAAAPTRAPRDKPATSEDRTAAALDSIARWIEKTEQRMSSAERITAERQERATSVVADAIKTIGSRIADIERRTQSEARANPERVEIPAAARATSTPSAEAVPTMRGGRPVLSREGLSAAVSDIRHRQRDLDGERGVVTELHANRPMSARTDEPRPAAPRFDPERQVAAALARSATPDNTLATDLLASLRQDLRDLGEKIGAPGRDTHELQDLRNDMSLLRNDVLKLARASGTGQIELSIRDLATRLQNNDPGQGFDALMRPLSRIEVEVSRLADTSANPVYSRIEGELSHIAGKIDALASRGSDGRVLAAATRELSAIRDLVADATSSQKLEELAGKLSALSGDIAQVRENQVKSRDIDTLHESISDMRKQIAAQAQPQDGGAMIGLSRQIEALSQRINTLPAPDTSETEAQLRRIAERLDRPQAVARPADDGEALKASQALSSRIESLVIKLEDLAERAPARFENRIESLTDKLERLASESATPRSGSERDAGLERKIEGLAERLDALAAQAATPAGTSRLEKQIESMASALEGLSSQNLGAKASVTLERQIEGISARLESLADSNRLSQIATMADGKTPVIDMRPLEDMLRGLSSKMDEAQQPDATAETLAALEKQVGRLAEKLDAAAIARADKGLEQTLQGLVTHFQGLRSETEAAAERVARDTFATEIRKVEARDATGLARLSDAVEGLQVRHDSTGQQTHNALDAVHDTLERIVARLGALERDIARAPADDPREETGYDFRRLGDAVGSSAMAPSSTLGSEPDFEPLPSSYPAEIERRVTESVWPKVGERRAAATAPAAGTGVLDVPLEPGSGRPKFVLPEALATAEPETAAPVSGRPSGEPPVPGLGAASGDLRNIIAAARRAAQVVKNEAQSAQMDVAVPGRKSKKAGAGLKETLEKRRKPILLGLAAIVLALGATHVLNSEIIGSKTVTPVSAPKAALQPPVSESLREETRSQPSGATDGPASTRGAPTSVRDTPALPGDRTSKVQSSKDQTAKDQASVLNPAPVGPPSASTSFVRQIDSTASTDRSGFVPEAQAGDQQIAALSETPEQPQSAATLAPVSGLKDLPATLGTPGLRKAALAGDARAVYELGVRAADGAGAQRDPKTAIKLFERAAAAGLAPAQFRLGNMFEKGVGAPRDVTLARLWYERAAEKGNAKAMHNLAVLYAEGATGKPDYAMAVEWFRKASEHGMRDSQFNLGVLLARGLGTEQNLMQSWTWFAVGAAQGDEDAAKKRDEVGTKLSPAELSAAKQAVARWKAKSADPSANEVVSPAQGWDEQPGQSPKKAPKARSV